jgi:HYR domain
VNPTVACVPPSGSTFPLGTTVDVCSASDQSGNTSSCSHDVTVVDTTPATVIEIDPAPLWPPNHKYHRVDLDECIALIQDACDGTLDVASHASVTCCTSDEPDNGHGDGNTTNDCVIVNNHSVDVRAERSGSGNGRVYTIHYTVTDGANNVTDHTCSVSVPHSQNGSPAVDDGPQTTCQ